MRAWTSPDRLESGAEGNKQSCTEYRLEIGHGSVGKGKATKSDGRKQAGLGKVSQVGQQLRRWILDGGRKHCVQNALLQWSAHPATRRSLQHLSASAPSQVGKLRVADTVRASTVPAPCQEPLAHPCQRAEAASNG